MPRHLIRLIAIVIALAVPLQGLAAVTGGICMAFGDHHEQVGNEGHGEDAHDHSTHSHGDETASEAQSGANVENADSDAHCGPCTACCASASITGPAGVSISSSPSNVAYVFSQFPPIGVQPDGLDRPPLAL